MGLSMSVGCLAFSRKEDPEAYELLRESFQAVNRLLLSVGLPAHEEPEKLPRMKNRFKHLGQPYGWLLYLRRAVAHAIRGRTQLKPLGKGKNPEKDPLYHDVLFSVDSHIVCHSDCEGFYVPVDFLNPLYDDLPDEDPRCVEGGILGSSQAVLRELVRVAPLLGISVAGDALSDKDFKQIHDKPEEGTALWIERQVWLEFFEAARLSIRYRTAIVFN
jgi:hypothetical protein